MVYYIISGTAKSKSAKTTMTVGADDDQFYIIGGSEINNRFSGETWFNEPFDIVIPVR